MADGLKMFEQLTRYFTAATRLRRSERNLVRAGAVMELEELRSETTNVKLVSRINEALNVHYAAKVKAS
jgi:hypothetical protein